MPSDTITQETARQAGACHGKDLLCGPQAAAITKRKLSQAEVTCSELRRSERLAKGARA